MSQLVTSKRVYLVALSVFTIWVVVLLGRMLYPQVKSTKHIAISSYAECVAAGYPVMESDPPQCRTPDGKLFIGAKPPVPSERPPVKPTEEPDTSAAAVDASRADIAKQLVVGVESITMVSVESVVWPDGCLGIHKADVMCTMALVPGYKVVLSFGNELYTYRTNKDGSIIAQEQ